MLQKYFSKNLAKQNPDKTSGVSLHATIQVQTNSTPVGMKISTNRCSADRKGKVLRIDEMQGIKAKIQRGVAALRRLVFAADDTAVRNSQNFSKGFTLIEVLVSITIISAIIASSTALYVSSLRTNSLNAKYLQALLLAQEGLEITRNIRDSNYLQGLNLDSMSGNSSLLTKDEFETGNFTVERKITLNELNAIKSSKNDQIQNLAPWKFKKINAKTCKDPKTCPQTALYLKETTNNDTKISHFTHESTSNTTSGFHRHIVIAKEKEGEKENDESYTIKSIVTWTDRGQTQEIYLETLLTNWKKGR
jgi:prepilin-type N-terminal cleavage/methylation domain-containing protein